MSIKWQALGSAALALLLGAPALLAVDESVRATRRGELRDFAGLSEDLVTMRDLFGGGNGDPVTFDADAATYRGVHPQGVELARQLADYTNELMAATAAALDSVDVTRVDVDLQKYPELARYLDEATLRRDDEPAFEPRSWLSEYVCGAFWRPRPGSAAGWKDWWSTNPSAVLSSWGYHTTPAFAGGGWTRPQTYSPVLCGLKTYRDHAYITSGGYFREQTYAGWTPRGEPNPEVWRSGPWPYATWPAYVRWWHATR
jgi:hypothetical protein